MGKQPVLIPVYTDENSIHRVQLFAQSDDGTFRRSGGSEPLRALRENITGASDCRGELISIHYDREERDWSAPTVKLYASRAQGYYEFLRSALNRNHIPVAMVSGMHGRVIKFALHDLVLKPGVSCGVLRLLKKRYAEAIDLWDEVPDAGFLGAQQVAS